MRPLPWAFVTAPITTRSHHAELAQLARAGYRFGGMPGYMSFPRSEGWDARDYGALCEAWCHCFREPDQFLPNGAPRALISYSDFTDPRHVDPHGLPARGDSDDYFLYVGAAEGWKQDAKNWRFAAQAIPKICDHLGLRAVVVGMPRTDAAGSPNVRFVDWLPWRRFLARLSGARFLFVPNECDPSPRVLAEALCLDVPLVVNRAILGGWKYVNAFTGVFFDGHDDVVEAARSCLAHQRRPRRWYRANFGPHLAGARLLRLLRPLDTRIVERSHLIVTERVGERSALSR
jgi:glycosyltransferase involved in cell wall biosynthesis